MTMTLTKYEYLYLKGKWDGPSGAAYNAVGEWCIENGLTDYFGFVTPKGEEAIKKYEGITYALAF